MGWAAAGAGAINLGTSIASYKQNKKMNAQMQANIAAALEELNKVGMPPDLSKEIIYQQFAQAGVLTPELEQEIEMQSSKMGELKERAPELRDQQMQALQLISQRGKAGLTPEDRAALNKVRQEVQRDVEAKRQQVLQNFAARGQGGSGNELIASLQASQAGADQASEQGDRIAAQASMNALQALGQSSNLAGQIREQDYGVDAARAAAMDELSRFNIENSRGVQQRNISARNQAQAANLGEKQRIQDANIQMANTEKLRQQEAKRQYWQDQLDLAQAKANARTGGNTVLARQASNYGGLMAGIGQAASGLASAYAQNQTNQQNQANLDRQYNLERERSMGIRTYQPPIKTDTSKIG